MASYAMRIATVDSLSTEAVLTMDNLDHSETPESWSFGRLVPVLACPACGSKRRASKPYCARDYLGVGPADEWKIWRCQGCASLFLDPRPDDASLGATYHNYYTHQGQSPMSRPGLLLYILWGAMNGYLRARFNLDRKPSFALGWPLCSAFRPLALKLDYFGRHLFSEKFPNRGVLVDVGCGNGEFLVQANEMGWHVFGIEPDQDAVKVCRAKGLNVIEGAIDVLPAELLGCADAVTLSHCIEHVIDPFDLLARTEKLLKPGGWIWIAIPNPEGLGIKAFGRSWRGLEPSRHLCIPSQRQLSSMLEKCGFEDIRLLSRGAHGKTITRESAQIAKLERARNGYFRFPVAWLGWLVRIAASVAGSISPRWAEETVIVARRSATIRRE